MSERRFQPPRPERTQFPGPVGPLEAIVEVPAEVSADVSDTASNAAPARFGVICHPNPVQGGTFTNKVVHTVARTFNELGVPTVRFNFRGVGASVGQHDEGRGETDDALAAIAYGRQRWPGAALWLAGFSFGGAIAVRVSQVEAPELLVTVSPAVMRLSVPDRIVAGWPWLVVQGDADDVVPAPEVLAWAGRLTPPPKVEILAGAGHFFHGRLNDVHDVVAKFARERVPGASHE